MIIRKKFPHIAIKLGMFVLLTMLPFKFCYAFHVHSQIRCTNMGGNIVKTQFLLQNNYSRSRMQVTKSAGEMGFKRDQARHERTHLRIISLVYTTLCFSILYYAGISGRPADLVPVEPSKWLQMAEGALSLTWSSMILAISFLEAWTKFRAPFLRKYIALDVGRHVFASFNAAELGIAGSFWLHRLFQCYEAQKILGGSIFYKNLSYYQQFSFTYPAVATMAFLFQIIVVAPKLFNLAKIKIHQGFDTALPSVKISLSEKERDALAGISQDVNRIKNIPSRNWHVVYVLLEVVKMACLNVFTILSWSKLII